MVKKNYLSFEKLDNKVLLSNNPWYVNTIKAPEVWGQLTVNSNKPIVAIVDSGIDVNHEALKNSLYKNPNEKVDGLDNDNNGYVDDISGWDFVDNDNIAQDGFYHGTFVAGIVNSVANGNVNILPLRFQNNNGLGYSSGAAAAIYYAIDLKNKGANIVALNCSFGGMDSMPPSLNAALQKASDNGILVVLAAGNNGVNMDVTPKYPGAIQYSNSITVGAINSDLSLAGYSNYGKNTVSVVAPGSNMYSTLPNNAYGSMSGSSFSTPVVSSVAALLKTFGNYTVSQIKNAIEQGSVGLGGVIDKIKYGLIDISKSLSLLKSWVKSPAPVVVVPSPVVPIVNKIVFAIGSVSRSGVSGWAQFTNSANKPIVDIYINNVLRYSVSANGYRMSTKSYNGFLVRFDKKLLVLNKNLVEIKIRDAKGSLVSIAYKNYI